MPSSTTDSQSVLDSARVEQTHAHDADPNHQEEVCSDECLLVVSPDLASSRLGIRDRSHQPYSGKQVFSEERVDTLDSANTRLRIIKERMKSRPGSDQMTAFTQMWQGTHSHNCQSGSKQPMRVVSRTLSAKSTRFNLPTTKRGAELKASNESLTENRISSAASKSALCNCLDFSDSACGHEEEATRMGESVLPHHQHWITGLTDKQQGLSSYSLQTGNDGQQQRQSLKTGPEENPYKFHVKTESSLGLKKGLRIKAAGSPLPQDTRIRNDSVEQGHGETSTLSGIYTEKVAESPTSNSLKSLKKELGTFSQVYSNHFSCLDRQGRDLTTSISNNSLLTDISVEPHCSSLIRERGPV
uniref:uncharacterized protein n=1 Tax=Pristiophorus japonicus TaxID=55135 RepID=UPI00398E63A1